MIVSSVVGSIAESTFNPKWVSNLQLWYDGADASTLFNNSTGSTLAAHSESIGRWEDKSGNNYHATQSNNALAPIRITSSYNGLDTVRFFLTPSGTGSHLLVTGSGLGIMNNKTACTYFAVFAAARLGVNSQVFSMSNNGVNPRYTLVNTGTALIQTISRRLDTDANTTSTNLLGATTSGSMLVLATSQLLYNESSSVLYVDGVEQFPSGTVAGFASYSGSTSATDSARIVLGNSHNPGLWQSQYLNGTIAELVFYNAKLNSTERRAVERYLNRKWNLRSYDQKTSASTDIFSNLDLYVDANNTTSNPGSGTTWTDLSGNGRNGTLTNGAAFATSQSISYVSCDGTNDYVDFGAILNYTSESFSLSGWFWFPTTEYGVEDIQFLFKGPLNTRGYYLVSGQVNRGSWSLGVSQSGTNQFNGTAIGAITPNRWWFLTVTRSGSSVRLYQNGVLNQTSINAITNPLTSSDNFLSARYVAGAFNIYSNLRIGLIIAHSKTLSDQEVLELYNFTKRSYNITD